MLSSRQIFRCVSRRSLLSFEAMVTWWLSFWQVRLFLLSPPNTLASLCTFAYLSLLSWGKWEEELVRSQNLIIFPTDDHCGKLVFLCLPVSRAQGYKHAHANCVVGAASKRRGSKKSPLALIHAHTDTDREITAQALLVCCCHQTMHSIPLSSSSSSRCCCCWYNTKPNNKAPNTVWGGKMQLLFPSTRTVNVFVFFSGVASFLLVFAARTHNTEEGTFFFDQTGDRGSFTRTFEQGHTHLTGLQEIFQNFVPSGGWTHCYFGARWFVG